MANELNLLTLGEQVKKYFAFDQAEKTAKKDKEPLNKSIKLEMRTSGLKEFNSDGIVADFSTQQRTTMNEAKLLVKLKELGLDNAIETVEKPNQAVVEDLVYNGKLDPAVLAGCIETKEVEVLKVAKAKKAKK